MKRLTSFLKAMAAALILALPAVVAVSCDDKPIDVVITDYGYTISLDDFHQAEGQTAECVIRLSSGGTRGESVTVNYMIDNDASLRVKVNGNTLNPGTDVTFDMSGQIVIQMPELSVGRHTLHLEITNQYGRSVTRDITFEVIHDKVWAKEVTAPAKVRLEAGSALDTTFSVLPADADIMAVRVESSNKDIAAATVAGDGSVKKLHVTAAAEGTATLSYIHPDFVDSLAATTSVEVFAYHIGGLNDMSIVEGKDVTFSLTVEPDGDVALKASNANVALQDLGNKTYKVTGVTPGSAILTATAGNTRQEAVVTVTKREETIAISPMGATITYGATKTFSVTSSAEFRAEINSDNAAISEVNASGVVVKNVNRSYSDQEATLTVINKTDENKKAVANVVLEKKPETVMLTETASSAGRTVIAVGGENAGWTLTASPSGVQATAEGNEIILKNNTYKSVTGKVSVATKTQGVTASKEVTVPGLDVTIQSLSMDPSSFTVEVGRSISASVTGHYVDGTQKDVTGGVTWTQSQNLQRSGNSFTAVSTGSAWIRASYEGLSVQVDGMVTMTVTDLTIEPSYFNALVGDNKAFSVKAQFSNNTSRDVTRECSYYITGGARESGKGYFTFTEPGECLIEAVYDYDGVRYSAVSRGNIVKPNGTVTRVGIDPMTAQCKVGEMVSFTGTVYYSDGSQDNTSGNWSVSDESILSGGGGRYVALNEGTAQVAYTCGQYGISATVTVQGGGGTGGGDFESLSMSCTSLDMQPGDVVPVVVIAHYTDGSVKDVTREATWTSSNSGVAQVDRLGYVSAVGAGKAIITAEWGNGVASLPVTVTAAIEKVYLSQSSLDLKVYGDAAQLSLTARYSDGQERDVTDEAAWNSDNTNIALVSNGKVTPLQQGSCVITASYGGKSAKCAVSVGGPEVDYIELVSSTYVNYSCNIGDEYGLNAVAHFKGTTSNMVVTTYATWECSPAGGLSFSLSSQNMRIKALKSGSYTIAVTYGGVTANAYCTVREAAPTVTGIVIEPTGTTLIPGATYNLSQVSCWYMMSNGSRGSVIDNSRISWSKLSGNNGVSVSGGVVTVASSATSGNAILQARVDGYTANFTVAVEEKALQGIQIDTGGVSEVTVTVGTEKCLSDEVTVWAIYEGGTKRDISNDQGLSWESLDQKVVTVSVKGGSYWIKGVKENSTATVRAKYNKMYADLRVKVIGDGNTYVQSISLNTTNYELNIGDAYTLKATVKPDDANQQVTWTSSDNNILTVNAAGVVTGVNTGKATVTATTVGKDKNGNVLSATCSFVVKNGGGGGEGTNVSVYIDRSSYSSPMSLGDRQTPRAVYSPSGCTLRWSSDNPNVISVNQSSGLCDAKAVGSAKITVTATYDGKSDSDFVVIEVKNSAVPATGISLSPSGPKTIYVGDEFNVTATVTPSNASNKSVSWSRSGDYVQLDGSGSTMKVKGVSAGTCSVIAQTHNGIQAKLDVTVKEVPVQEIIFDSSNPKELNVGTTGVVLSYRITPSNAPQGVTWKSSNSNYVSIDAQSGKMNALKAGSCVITATSVGVDANGRKVEKTYDIKVVEPERYIVASEASVTWTWDDVSEHSITFTNSKNINVSGLTCSLNNTSAFTATMSNGVLKVKPKNQNKTQEPYTGVVTVKAAETNNGNPITAEISLRQNGRDAERLAQIILPSTTAVVMNRTTTITPQCKNQYNETMSSVPTLSWSSSDTSVATVSNGVVTGKKVSSSGTNITASYGTVTSNSCKVTVTPLYVTGISVSPNGGTLKVGETLQLTASVNPSNATDTRVSWSSSDASLATVDQNGLVKAVSVGNGVGTKTVKITATALGSEKSGAVKYTTGDITIKPADKQLKEIDVVPADGWNLNVGSKMEVTAKAIYTDNSEEVLDASKVTWKISNTQYLSHSVSNGRCWVTATKPKDQIEKFKMDETITATYNEKEDATHGTVSYEGDSEVVTSWAVSFYPVYPYVFKVHNGEELRVLITATVQVSYYDTNRQQYDVRTETRRNPAGVTFSVGGIGSLNTKSVRYVTSGSQDGYFLKATKEGSCSLNITYLNKTESFSGIVYPADADMDASLIRIDDASTVVTGNNWSFSPKFKLTFDDGTTETIYGSGSITYQKNGKSRKVEVTVYCDYHGNVQTWNGGATDASWWNTVLEPGESVRFKAVCHTDDFFDGNNFVTRDYETQWYMFGKSN